MFFSPVPFLFFSGILNKIRCSKRKYRGVIFLDPYGLEVRSETLKLIVATECFDVWYLFPTSGVYRQAPRDHIALDRTKRNALNNLFGTRSWESAFYDKSCEGTNKQLGFLDDMEEEQNLKRTATVKQIEDWGKKWLEGIFSYVSAPLVLPRKGTQFYSLFFCVSNKSKKAINLAKKVSAHILNQPL